MAPPSGFTQGVGVSFLKSERSFFARPSFNCSLRCARDHESAAYFVRLGGLVQDLFVFIFVVSKLTGLGLCGCSCAYA